MATGGPLPTPALSLNLFAIVKPPLLGLDMVNTAKGFSTTLVRVSVYMAHRSVDHAHPQAHPCAIFALERPYDVGQKYEPW